MWRVKNNASERSIYACAPEPKFPKLLKRKPQTQKHHITSTAKPSVSDVAIDASYSIHGTLFFISTKAEVKRTPFLICCVRERSLSSTAKEMNERDDVTVTVEKRSIQLNLTAPPQLLHQTNGPEGMLFAVNASTTESSNVDLKICFLMPKNKEINDVSFLLAHWALLH